MAGFSSEVTEREWKEVTRTRAPNRIVWIALLALFGCDRTANRESTAADGTGGIEVEVVGPGVISTELPEFASAFSPDGDTIYFNRTPSDRSSIGLFYSVHTDSGWSESRPFPPTQGITAIDPFLSSDGRRLFFATPRVREISGNESLSIWFVERTHSGWSELQEIGEPINSDSTDYFLSLATDGTVAFSSTRNRTLGIYISSPSPSGWSDPELLTLEGAPDASNPLISPDGTLMVVSATSEDGSSDLMVACRIEKGWSRPRALPDPVNSRFAEFAPAIAGDYLYYTSERPGIVGPSPDSIRPPGDLYRTPIRVLSDMCQP